jgi:tetrahydromethanopterin S-methyltransferase subunit C
LTNQKLYSTIFKVSQVVADPSIALAFIFSPFGIKHQNGINLGPFNPIAAPKSSIRIQRQ